MQRIYVFLHHEFSLSATPVAPGAVCMLLCSARSGLFNSGLVLWTGFHQVWYLCCYPIELKLSYQGLIGFCFLITTVFNMLISYTCMYVHFTMLLLFEWFRYYHWTPIVRHHQVYLCIISRMALGKVQSMVSLFKSYLGIHYQGLPSEEFMQEVG